MKIIFHMPFFVGFVIYMIKYYTRDIQMYVTGNFLFVFFNKLYKLIAVVRLEVMAV